MRIIAGEFRGRRLLPPATDTTRPVTDRVKQSVFDILAPLIADAAVYDCFAGTGSMGLECLSRGAAHATFFEADRSAAARLKTNINTLGIVDRSTIITSDLFRWFRDGKTPGAASLIFLDPPYRFLRERPDDLRQLGSDLAARHVTSDATLVFRHDAADALDLPQWSRCDIREYGGMTVEFLRLERPPTE
jgi:16S rRNA (guanine966-N2)-methyltransferase